MIQYWILMILIFDCLHLAAMWLLDRSYLILSHFFIILLFLFFFLYLSIRLYLDSSFLWAWKIKVLLASMVICYLLIHWSSYYLLTNFALSLTHTVIPSLLFSSLSSSFLLFFFSPLFSSLLFSFLLFPSLLFLIFPLLPFHKHAQ